MRMLGLLAGMAMVLALPVAAQEYPTKPIRIITPFAPGAASDIARDSSANVTATALIEGLRAAIRSKVASSSSAASPASRCSTL